MGSKPLTGKEFRPILAATGISPADYPLGSPESRAAARVWFEARQPKLSQDDADALLIYECDIYLCGHCNQAYRETAVYGRGQELGLPALHERNRPGIERKPDAELWAKAGITVPDSYSACSVELLKAMKGVGLLAFFKHTMPKLIEAWKRQFPDLIFPLRLDLQEQKVWYCNFKNEWVEDDWKTESVRAAFSELNKTQAAREHAANN